MNRKLFTALAAAGAISIGTGVMATPASATPRTFVVTLLGGSQVTLTVDVPAGTPADQITFPGLSAPVVSVQEITPAPTATPGVGVTVPTPVPTLPPTPGSSGSSGGSGSSGSGSGAGSGTPGVSVGGSSSQQTSTHKPSASGGKGGNLVSTVGGAAKKAAHKALADPGPSVTTPGFTLAQPGAAPIGVPNFFIDKFRIPPFLLPIYQAAGIQYGIRWEILAAINEIETDYGRNLNVSTAGAVGWMQFLPSTFQRYAVDANRDGVKDPYNPVDAIFTAARYLKAAGADTDVRKAIFAYNHANWYVDSVMLRARVLGGLPANFVGSLTGLTQGHFPVAARATYADAVQPKKVTRRTRVIDSSPTRTSIKIYSRKNAPAIAVQDGRIVRTGTSKRLGHFVMLQDVYGNTYTYGQLKSVARLYPAPKPKNVSQQQITRELALPKTDAAPNEPATAGDSATSAAPAPATDALKAPLTPASATTHSAKKAKPAKPAATPAATSAKERLFANPFRPNSTKNGGGDQIIEGKAPRGSYEVFRAGASRIFGVHAKSKDLTLKPLKKGARVMAGTVLGRLGIVNDTAPHVLFEIRPAGKGAPRIDPKPILDGWKLLESTAIYRAAGKNPFFGSGAATPTIGQILLMSKEALQRQVLADPRVQIYDCGRRDIRLGVIDRRVLATLEFLSLSGLKPTVSALECGHSLMTASGNISEHSSGNAVDIAAVNGIPIVGHQGPGSITDITIQRLLTLQGLMKPHQIISLMTFKNADNTLALPDHYDHIHVGFRPMYGTNSKMAKQVNATLKPKQWIKLINRLNTIDNPTVRVQPSKYAIKNAPKSGSKAHSGD